MKIDYLKSIGALTVLSCLIWLIGFAIGFNLNINLDASSGANYSREVDQLLIKRTKFDLFKQIFNTNLKLCISNILGCLTLGLVSVKNLIFNGINQGLFTKIFLAKFSITKLVDLTFRHLIELLAIFLSSALGFRVSWILVLSIYKKKFPSISLLKVLLTCVFLIILILLIAAYIEAYYSMPIDIIIGNYDE